MKEETYKKALKQHQDMIAEYADKLHDFVLEMLDGNCSANEVIGLLESMKLYLFNITTKRASMDALEDLLDLLNEE